MINLTEYRDSCASTDEDNDETIFCSLSSNQTQEIAEDDSEPEFNRILEMSRRRRDFYNTKMDDNCFNSKNLPRCKRDKVFDPEYYSLPAIEQLNIQVKEETDFKRFGVVESHINFLAKIRPDKDAPHLGYETILFDKDKKPIGEIFEIFGTVAETWYALRFNDENEALTKLPVGEMVYYANAVEAVTKAVFPKELAKLKHWDRVRSSGDSSSSEEIFSDDEEEKRHLARKRQKTRPDRPLTESAPNNSNTIPKKRTKVGMNMPGQWRNANHSAYPRQAYSGPATANNYYMPMYPQFPPNFGVPFSHLGPPPPYPPNSASFNSPLYFPQQQYALPYLQQQFLYQQGYIQQRPPFIGQQRNAPK